MSKTMHQTATLRASPDALFDTYLLKEARRMPPIKVDGLTPRRDHR